MNTIIKTLVVFVVFFLSANAYSQLPVTSKKVIISSDSVHIDHLCLTETKDGNFLLSGYYIKPAPDDRPFYNGSLIKLSRDGHIIWNKNYDFNNIMEIPARQFFYYKVIELHDNSILLVGQIPNPVTLEMDLLLTKTDMSGDVIWSRTYRSQFWEIGAGNSSVNAFYINSVNEDPLGHDIYLLGSNTDKLKKCIIRFNHRGDIFWSKTYHSSSIQDVPFGMDLQDNEIRLFSLSSSLNETGMFFDRSLGVYRIRKNNGDTIQSKFWKTNFSSRQVDFLANINVPGVTKDAAGNYLLYGPCIDSEGSILNDSETYYHGAVVKITNNLNFLSAFAIKSNLFAPPEYSSIRFDKNANGIISLFNYPEKDTNYILQFKNGQLAKQRQILSNSLFAGPASVYPSSGADYSIKAATTSGIDLNLSFLKLNVSDSDSCYGENISAFSVVDFTYVPVPPFNEVVEDNIFQPTDNPHRNVFESNYLHNETIICIQSTVVSNAYNKSVSNSLHLAGIKIKNIEQAYPNPFEGEIIFSVNSEKDAGSTIQVISENGLVVFSFQKSLRKGSNLIKLNTLDRLSKGTYKVIVKTPEVIYTGKITKL